MIYSERQNKIRNLLFSNQKANRDLGWQLDWNQNDGYFHAELSNFKDDWDFHYKTKDIHIENDFQVKKYNNLLKHSPNVTNLVCKLEDDITMDLYIPSTIMSIYLEMGQYKLKNSETLLKGLTNLNFCLLRSPHNKVKLYPENINPNLDLELHGDCMGLLSECDQDSLHLLNGKSIKSLTIVKCKISRELVSILYDTRVSTLTYAKCNLPCSFSVDGVETLRIYSCKFRNLYDIVMTTAGIKNLEISNDNYDDSYPKVMEIDTLEHVTIYGAIVDFTNSYHKLKDNVKKYWTAYTSSSFNAPLQLSKLEK